MHPATLTISLKAIGRGLKGATRSELEIVRSIAGLTLPIRCYTALGPPSRFMCL